MELRSGRRMAREPRSTSGWAAVATFAPLIVSLLGCEGESGPAGPQGLPGSDVLLLVIRFTEPLPVLRADGVSTLPIEARVLTEAGNSVADVRVRFAVEAGDGAVSPSEVTTDALGRAVCTYTVGTEPGDGILVASIRQAGLTITESVSVYADPLEISGPLLPTDFGRDLVPHWSPDGSSISFHPDRDYGLFLTSPGGGAPRFVGDYCGGAWDPRRADRLLVFDRDNYTSIVDTAGTVISGPFRPIDLDDRIIDAAWTHDGDSLLVAPWGPSRFYMYDSGLTTARAIDWLAVESVASIPGSSSVVALGRFLPDAAGLFRLDLDAREATLLLFESDLRWWILYPGLTTDPEAEWVVFTRSHREYPSRGRDLYRVPAAGGVADPLLSSPADESFPAWSPDGTRVIFSSDRALRSAKYNLYIWDLSKAGS